MTNKISYLDDGEVCMLTKNDVTFDSKQTKINKKIHTVSDDQNTSDKGDYKNFMSKRFLNNREQ